MEEVEVIESLSNKKTGELYSILEKIRGNAFAAGDATAWQSCANLASYLLDGGDSSKILTEISALVLHMGMKDELGL